MKLPAFIICLLIIPFNTFAQVNDLHIHQKVDSLFAEYDTLKPGVALVILKDGKIDYSKGYGLDNLEYDIPVTPETKFHIASLSKQFTAFSIYLLIKEGKLSLEDDVKKFIPELPRYNKTIQIKHLLAHTSGLRDQWALLTLAGWDMEDIIRTDQILKLVSRQKQLNFETDSRFSYSNTGYTLLAEIVNRVSGESFASFTTNHIFNPLGMKNTVFNTDFHQVIKNKAHSYELTGGQFEERRLNYSTVGATSLVITAEDLAKWVINFENPIVGDKDLIQEFTQISSYSDGKQVIWSAQPNDTTYHAKGQLHWKYKGLHVISHGGHDAGFRAVLMRFPENNLAIITLSNNEHYQILGKVLPVADLYLNKKMVTVPSTPPYSTTASPQKKETFTNNLNDYIGNYQSEELATEYKIQQADNKLILTHHRLRDIVLTPVGKDRFSGINGFSFEMNFVCKLNKITGFTISNFGVKNLVFSKKR